LPFTRCCYMSIITSFLLLSIQQHH
jgi:hypothetical protein